MTKHAPLVVMTGASGFIGRALVPGFLTSGFRVRALVRSPTRFMASIGAPSHAVDCVAWKLSEPAPAGAFAGSPVALVHLAFATRGPAAKIYALNVDGTRLLLDAVRDADSTFRVFVSSFSAGPPADAGLSRVSAYSRAKQELERLFDPARDLIVRPGLVVGGGGDGLFARMRAQLDRGVPLPLFYRGEAPVQWIHVDELVDTLVRSVERRTTGLYSVASPQAVTLTEWTDAVARTLGLRARTFPVPDRVSDLVGSLLRGVERLGIRLPATSDTVFGIKYARIVDTRDSLERLGISVGGLEATLKRAV